MRRADVHEARQQGHRVACLDQPHMRLQVGGLVAHVGLEPGTATRLLCPVPRGRAPRLHDPGQLGRVGERCRVVERLVTRPLLRQRKANRVARERLAVEPDEVCGGVARILLGDHEIEAPRPGVIERGLWFVLHHFDTQHRVLRSQALER